MTFAASRYNGGWNDEHENGKAGLDTNDFTQCFGCSDRPRSDFTSSARRTPQHRSTPPARTTWREPYRQSQGISGQPGSIWLFHLPSLGRRPRQCASREEAGAPAARVIQSHWTQHPPTVGWPRSTVSRSTRRTGSMDIVPERWPCAVQSSHRDVMSNGHRTAAGWAQRRRHGGPLQVEQPLAS